MPSYEVISTFDCLRSITILMITVLKFPTAGTGKIFSGKDQTVNIFGLVGHLITAATPHFCL